MPKLSDDERIVLMIADGGESMMPIGRWEQPVEHLVALGYLQRHDKFNNSITKAGRSALNGADEEDRDQTAKTLIELHNAQAAYRKNGEKIALQLAVLAAELAAVTGDSVTMALQKCVAAIRDRALDILDG